MGRPKLRAPASWLPCATGAGSCNLRPIFFTLSAFILISLLWNMSVINPEGAEEPCVEDGLLRRRPSSRTGKHAEYHYWHNFEVRGREEARKWRKTWRQSDYPYSKGVDVLLIPRNLAWAQHLVGGVPNLFPSPPLLSWHAQCRRKRVIKTTYKVLQKCCMSKTSTPLEWGQSLWWRCAKNGNGKKKVVWLMARPTFLVISDCSFIPLALWMHCIAQRKFVCNESPCVIGSELLITKIVMAQSIMVLMKCLITHACTRGLNGLKFRLIFTLSR